MINISKGRYWDKGIQLIDGCTPCSPGCDNCWSAGMTHRFVKKIKGCTGSFQDNTVNGYETTIPSPFTDGAGRFNGKIETHPDRLDVFRKTRKPTVFAVWNDLFHEGVPKEFIAEVYSSMWFNGPNSWWVGQPVNTIDGHIFLILTKRQERMKNLLTDDSFWELAVKKGCLDCRSIMPVPYIWHGLTVCNQPEADAKLTEFLRVPGKKFLSIEPMLGEIDLHFKPRLEICPHGLKMPTSLQRWYDPNCRKYCDKSFECKPIDAVILGGETGAKARPMNPDWVRSVRDQCEAAGVPFFFKGWGEFGTEQIGKIKYTTVNSGVSMDYPAYMYKVGRAKAGRLLDGREHNELPWVKK
jgi:protein gp37